MHSRNLFPISQLGVIVLLLSHYVLPHLFAHQYLQCLHSYGWRQDRSFPRCSYIPYSHDTISIESSNLFQAIVSFRSLVGRPTVSYRRRRYPTEALCIRCSLEFFSRSYLPITQSMSNVSIVHSFIETTDTNTDEPI